MGYHLEVGARTVEDVLAAERGGADRVELYASPLEGALTPSAGLIKSAAEAARITLFVMIRPRAGDFLYTAREFETIQRDVDIALEMGADGIMCGILKPDGELDTARMKPLIAQCGDTPFALHRAFDFSRDPLETLELAIDLGCESVLTMGQEGEALFSRELRQQILAAAGDRIKVVIALGADFDTATELRDVMRETGAREYHIVNGYRKRPSGMRWTLNAETHSDFLRETMFSMDYLCEHAVREIRDIFDQQESGGLPC
ncbi:MAG: copper homeostasis protein CutC [Lentisphaerae bacterium]|nr:copper homeostasis protein CutC [Lentisphaerota bacterium]MBT4814252.1 copper homeostasis protein CutC [Lentisphaerota bacterium]MBT5610972.1 copper homeostasis protein CutC [Lentisphaerota bacterium]MBT7058059.1 copper homeostasis protein CutC [Lentisphaerota bacterium]MBT7848068.1 copper homeostasis protein CutC [Lentisphaerota bacterium]